MKAFFEYWKQRRKILGLLALFCCIFAVTFALYELPLRAVWYPAALCAVVGLAAAVIDFYHIQKVHKDLARVKTMSDTVTERFPQSDGLIERDYQQIIRLLTQEQAAFRTETGKRYDDMVDYYTTWAHQIKTPIASMRLTLQNEDSPLSRKLQADLFRVEQYVEMVLMFLRLDSDSSDYLIRVYDLDMIIRQSVKKFAGEFIGRKLQLVYEPLHIAVITDEKWLSFVIEQVLSNALKYTPSGSIRIFLERPKTLCVQDTGMGIAPEDLPRVFEKGYTGYHGRADQKASGIGLYLCRRTCTNLGHTITAESEPGVGTIIRIDLSQDALEVE